MHNKLTHICNILLYLADVATNKLAQTRMDNVTNDILLDEDSFSEKIQREDDDPWVLGLTIKEKITLQDGNKLTDRHIDAAQKMIAAQFENI